MPAAAVWRRLHGGRTSEVSLARHAGGAVVCKRSRPGTGGPLFPVDPRAEAAAMAALAHTGLAMPPRALFRHGPDWVLLYDFVPGSGPVAPDTLARLLHAVHAVRALQPRPTRRLHPTLHAGLMARARTHLATSGWTERRLARLDREVAAASAAPMGPPCLVHGDPVPGNVLADGDMCLLIDWQCVHRGEPARDLAIAASPAMQKVYGGSCSQTDTGTAAAYPDRDVAARLDRLQTAFHLQMIGHCLWRSHRGDLAYRVAAEAEARALDDRLSD